MWRLPAFTTVLLSSPFFLAHTIRGALILADPNGPSAGSGSATTSSDAKVIILGGGVSGVIAARTLKQNGINNFVIVEARSELGGRMRSQSFGGVTVELGANWVQGTQTGTGPINPILQLAKKHNVKTQFNDLFGSIATYDNTGQVDYLDLIDAASDNLDTLTVAAGARVAQNLVDASARTGYSLTGAKPRDHHADATEYYLYDWEYAQKPDQSSWIASSWNNNFTFVPEQGGFSEDNLLSIDQRGFKTLIQQEAATFLSANQTLLNSTVKTIAHSSSGVVVTLTNGQKISGDYALCTFSLGVLQNDDVQFTPVLPQFKQESIHSLTMATYTKIFLKFPRKFWFDTEMALYADPERGRYPVWQSLDHENFLPGSGIIFVTVTGDFSKRIEALPDAQVKAEVMGVLRSMFPPNSSPNISASGIPEPTDFFFPRWNSDPLYRGSYSNWPQSFVNEHHDNLRANVGRLYFAGEATSFKYFGFLHGAYFEGLNVGLDIVACIKQGQCSQLPHEVDVTTAHPYRLN